MSLTFRRAIFADHDDLAALFEPERLRSNLPQYHLCPLIESGQVVVGVDEEDRIIGFVAVEKMAEITIRVLLCSIIPEFLNRSSEFLLPCFAIYPDCEICLASQASEEPLAPLLHKFTLIDTNEDIATLQLNRDVLLDDVAIVETARSGERRFFNVSLNGVLVGAAEVKETSGSEIAELNKFFDCNLRDPCLEVIDIQVREEILVNGVLKKLCSTLSCETAILKYSLGAEGVAFMRFFSVVLPRRASRIRAKLNTRVVAFEFEDPDILDERETSYVCPTYGLAIFNTSFKRPLPSPTRIVIVGYSETVVSTVVGLQSSREVYPACVTIVSPKDLVYDRDLLQRHKLDVKHVRASVQAVIPTLQSLVLTGEVDAISYDILVIADSLVDVTLNSFGQVDGAVPLTSAVISTLFDEDSKGLNSLHWNPLAKVVLYGAEFPVFQMIHHLLEKQVSPKKIELMIPHAENEALENRSLLSFMVPRLKELGITIHNKDRGLSIKSLDAGKDGKLRGFSAISGDEEIHIDCRYLLTYYKLETPKELISSLKPLVTDNMFFVSDRFETADPRIYVVGECAVFSDNELNQKTLQQRELGAAMAEVLLYRIAPMFANIPYPSNKQYEKPILLSGKLPGNFYYHRVIANGRFRAKTCEKIFTDTLDEGGCIFQVHLDKFDRVNSVVYIGRYALFTDSLMQLIGLSASFLNNFKPRWDAGRIPDILEYLSEDWAHALFHPQLPSLIEKLRGGCDREKIKEFLKENELKNYAL